MIPVQCRVKHDPENGSYGDCLRACIASILELDAEDVPNFVENGASVDVAFNRIIMFLKERALAPFFSGYDGSQSLSKLLEFMEANNPNSHYALFGSTADGNNHVVVCKGGSIVHNPAWYGNALTGPTIEGHWLAMVICLA